ncbi:TetR/AcrR family transcriptional regulator [Nocardia goodfellowii]|uniref:AcrR family transcriptional regulator n=1 Tax=Nocardia goodfellowii TaxID=882446 RepID=A0ABS4QP64_9NOCA|nr:TetR/AcrR family transcriptional regulator [Nocardia goodfellowii]MBP2192446.1 AcrR family transcriptional regulator [Nocardia goodfellowii]
MDPRKQRTIDALMAAAGEIFSERPADEVTVEEIAERAGVAVGSIYNHFGSKSGLHAAVVDRALDLDRRFIDLAFTADRGPAEQIYAVAEQYLQFYLQYPEYFRMLAAPAAPGGYSAGRELSERLARNIKRQNDRLAQALSAGIDAGIARPIDPSKVATVLLATWNGIISLNWRPDQLRRTEAELRDLLETAADVIAHGLLRTPK